MRLEELGWNSFFDTQLSELEQAALEPARVVEEFKGFQRVHSGRGERLAEISGKIRYEAEGREDFPAVGDWVGISPRPEDRARIEYILPRRTKLARKAAGRTAAEQIVATNLDVVFVVASLNREFNLRRIERYLSLVWDSGARPAVVLNKADLCADAGARMAEVEVIALGTPVSLLSAVTGAGLDDVRGHVAPGETAAFVGSSGVGKSTIITALTNQSLRVQPVRESDGRGLHTTTSRQLIFLPGGGMVIDTPGMRELGMLDSEEGVAQAFDDIEMLAENCRFRDCGHRGEPGCAVEAAVRDGSLDYARLANHRKLEAEMSFLERKEDPVAARAQKEKWKRIHKAIRKMPKKF